MLVEYKADYKIFYAINLIFSGKEIIMNILNLLHLFIFNHSFSKELLEKTLNYSLICNISV